MIAMRFQKKRKELIVVTISTLTNMKSLSQKGQIHGIYNIIKCVCNNSTGDKKVEMDAKKDV